MPATAVFEPLAALVCQALLRTSPPDLKHIVCHTEDEAREHGTASTGLQVAWMVYDDFPGR